MLCEHTSHEQLIYVKGRSPQQHGSTKLSAMPPRIKAKPGKSDGISFPLGAFGDEPPGADPMPILYAVADGSGATYSAGEAHLYDWFNNEQAARSFIRKGRFDPLYEGTTFRVDLESIDDDMLCSLFTQNYESRVNIRVIKAPLLQ